VVRPLFHIGDRGIKKAAEKIGFKVEIKNNSSYKDIQNWNEKIYTNLLNQEICE
jgi:basic membrane lipoprotein Med (substrate-binding protein (PBP1-ABC) superfamily)